MSEQVPRKIVLAYSGSLDSSIAIRWLEEHRGAEVVAVALDLGQGRELNQIRERAAGQARGLQGRIANARAGKPKPFSTLGQVTTMIAPVAGTLSRLAMTSI